MRLEVEYKCGCVFSNNRWFPECPRHGEWWSSQAGTQEAALPNKKYKYKGALILYTRNTLRAINRVKDDSVSLVLTYPMFQYKDNDMLNFDDCYFKSIYPKVKEDGTFILMASVSNIASSVIRLESAGFYVRRISQVLYGNNVAVSEPCVILVANKNNVPIKCKYGLSTTLGRSLYFSNVASTEAYLVRNFSPDKGLVFDPFCTNIHTLDGTLHERRRFIGFCEGTKQFDLLKFFIDNFKADQHVFSYPQ